MIYKGFQLLFVASKHYFCIRNFFAATMSMAVMVTLSKRHIYIKLIGVNRLFILLRSIPFTDGVEKNWNRHPDSLDDVPATWSDFQAV